MANGSSFNSPAAGEMSEDDICPALFAETHPLPAAAPVPRRSLHRLPFNFDRADRRDAPKELVA